MQGPVASFTAGGAYDCDSVHDDVAARHPNAAVVVPPRAHAVPSKAAETAPTQRDRHLRAVKGQGRTGWQAASGYTWRALAGAGVSRFKRVIDTSGPRETKTGKGIVRPDLRPVQHNA